MDGRVALRVVITGRVQGVGYREWTRRTATALGLDGFVRNRRDGSVEALVSGPAEGVSELVDRMRSGPPSAHVTGLRTEVAAAPERAGFDLLPTS